MNNRKSSVEIDVRKVMRQMGLSGSFRLGAAAGPGDKPSAPVPERLDGNESVDGRILPRFDEFFSRDEHEG